MSTFRISIVLLVLVVSHCAPQEQLWHLPKHSQLSRRSPSPTPIGPIGSLGYFDHHRHISVEEQNIFTLAMAKKVFGKVKKFVRGAKRRGDEATDAEKFRVANTDFDFLDPGSDRGKGKGKMIVERIRPPAHDHLFSDDSDGDEIKEGGIALQPLATKNKGKGIVIKEPAPSRS